MCSPSVVVIAMGRMGERGGVLRPIRPSFPTQGRELAHREKRSLAARKVGSLSSQQTRCVFVGDVFDERSLERWFFDSGISRAKRMIEREGTMIRAWPSCRASYLYDRILSICGVGYGVALVP